MDFEQKPELTFSVPPYISYKTCTVYSITKIVYTFSGLTVPQSVAFPTIRQCLRWLL